MSNLANTLIVDKYTASFIFTQHSIPKHIESKVHTTLSGMVIDSNGHSIKAEENENVDTL